MGPVLVCWDVERKGVVIPLRPFCGFHRARRLRRGWKFIRSQRLLVTESEPRCFDCTGLAQHDKEADRG